nr:15911_t:CDS:2 [Entrophospora candida]CAG8449309.1 143_t:CDS:2 [Entrophospora candida]
MSQASYSLAHRRYVTSLYKRSLKLALDWYVERRLWRPVALEIRAKFEANRNVSSTKQLKEIFLATEAELQKYSHPDPYKAPTSPDGSKWERNIPPPVWNDEKIESQQIVGGNIDEP